MPIPAAEIGLEEFKLLNDGNLKFASSMASADQNDPAQAFFVSEDGKIKDYAGSITSFLCTDQAYDIFAAGGNKLDTLALRFATESSARQGRSCRERPHQRTMPRGGEEILQIRGHRGIPRVAAQALTILGAFRHPVEHEMKVSAAGNKGESKRHVQSTFRNKAYHPVDAGE